MKIGKLSIFLFLVIYSSVVTAFDTTILSQVPKAPKQTTKTQSLAETKSFAFTIIDDLPANYLGHSYGDLHRALIARQKFVTRGAYESTIDFDTRIARLNERPLVGTTNFRSRFAFTFLPNAEQFSMTYDPDLSALDILLKWARRSEFPGNLFSLTWTDSSRKVSSYLGRNAFNRSVRVSVFRNDSFYLVTEKRNLERLEKVNVGFTDASLLTSIPMQPNDARLAKLNLRWLVIGHLAENAVLNNYSHDTPEITDPYDRYNYDFAINLIVEKMWLYDSRTGNVYLRFEDRGAESPRISESPKSDLTTESILESLEGLELVSPVKQGITQELKIISKPRPGYTDSARLNNIEGTVVLNVTFLASGQIGRVEPLERLPDGLTEQAIAAAKRISFEPALERLRYQYTG